MPNSNEEILLKKFPEDKQIEVRKIQKFLNESDYSGAAIGSMKPKGDVHFSPHDSSCSSIEESQNCLEFDDIQAKSMHKNGWDLMLIQAADSASVKTAFK